jgi:hypothetical protein
LVLAPWVRYRLPTAVVLVLAAGTATVLAAGHPPWTAWAGWTLAALLGVWWSAPRAGVPPWPELVLLALASAGLAAGRVPPATWTLPGAGLALASAHGTAGRAAAAWALAAGAALAVRPAHPAGAAALVLALGCAVGRAGVRRRAKP